MIKSFRADLVASLVLPNADEAIHNSQHSSKYSCDDSGFKARSVPWSVLRLEK